MTAAPVLCDWPAPGVGRIVIDRPDRLNALNLEVKRLIERFVVDLAQDPAVSVIVLSGSPTVFVAGTDIAEMRDMTPTQHAEWVTDGVFTALRACPKPVIAAVEGYALGGGCELALACDIIVAGEGARFGQPEIRVGIMPGAGGTQLLLRTIGKYRTMKLALTGEQVPAAEALAMGMVSEVVEAGRAMDRALELANTICGMPPLAVRGVKEAVRLGQDMPLTAALAMERKIFQLLFDTADQAEGMQAFLDKRRPDYKGA
ncbi:MAG TPA: enoyl-CoA hydratase-related protein [Caulobacteraceae bacterium]|jgi:enoyl-CoA hydratase/carnithine racemase|nr:enoyl-CoA hydratase-related protein [Caulobacteraceae bacterium]